MKKLTLSADEEVIVEAKRLARRNQTSVSSMFSQFIRLLAARDKGKAELGPLTRRATGLVSLPKGKSDRDLVAEALIERHGLNT